MGNHFGIGSNPAQTRVGYKEIRKCALQDHNPDALIALEFPAEFVEFLRQNFIKKIYRRVIDAYECDSRINPELETCVIRILQGSFSISACSMFSPRVFTWARANRNGRRGRPPVRNRQF